MGKEMLEPSRQPQPVGLQIPPGLGVKMPVPVVMQARFELKPLAGEAQVHGGARRIDRLHLALV
jgi:hypothetical protein